MRGRVREVAKAQGLEEEFAALQQLRQGLGVKDHWDLRRLPSGLRERLFGSADGSEAALISGLARLEELVEAAPPQERSMLRLCFNLDPEFGALTWLDRVNEFVSISDRSGGDRTVRYQADVALLQLIIRTNEAAESTPDAHPRESPVHMDDSATVLPSRFFTQDYVKLSPEFLGAWRSSSSVDIIGFGHNRMAVSFSREMVTLLKAGGALRVLMQDPEGRSVLEANLRSSTPRASAEAVRHQNRAGAATFQAIADAASGKGSLEIRLFDCMPPFTGYFFDTSQQSAAIAFVWFWSWKQSSAERPGFFVRASEDPLWHARFAEQFEGLWRDHANDGVIAT